MVEEKIDEIKIKNVVETPAVAETVEEKVQTFLDTWKPKTKLGKEVFEGKITSIDEIFDTGQKIIEFEIVDKLVPNIKNELVLIGGRTGKGGGIQRIPVKITAHMKKSGRRFTTNAFVVVGNEDGLVGVGRGSAVEARDAIEKGIRRAKTNLIRVKRGCGNWECGCGTPHSVKFKITGKCGSVRVELMPASKGVGLVADDETKKILRLAGIKDVYVKTFGNTGSRTNLLMAGYDALKKLYIYEKV